jgi:lipopolysaccharide/colanic/teichoic acid biosynthesis glycosyltransferase
MASVVQTKVPPQAASHQQPGPAQRKRFQRSLKRLTDFVLAVPASILLLPACVVIAALIKLDSHGPVFFVADRVGEGGKLFKLYKFRSMVEGAQQQLQILSHLNAGGGFMVKIPSDPRVTSLGKVLRKYSLDELPQLWNVIRGDMSLVGPRPQAPNEVSLYDDQQRRRLAAPAGITGLWQVTARNDPRFDVWVAKDLEYIDNWSLRLDFIIILKTIPVILAGRGAAPSAEPPIIAQ